MIPRKMKCQPSAGCQNTILPSFPKNCMKLGNLWALEGGSGRRPLVTPLTIAFCVCAKPFVSHKAIFRHHTSDLQDAQSRWTVTLDLRVRIFNLSR